MTNSICVYCGSRAGRDPAYTKCAQQLGKLLARRKRRLVFGGGSVGMMGTIADAALAAGGEVTGVIPGFLADSEIKHPGVADMRIVEDMHERKAMMADISAAFIALPGGFGTLEELFETITWAQLQIHHKPIGLLNVNGYFDALLAFLDHAFETDFIKPIHRKLFVVATTPEEMLDKLDAFEPVTLTNLRSLKVT
ncbi:LOG family protein YvdD [Calycomorphotria hydatis]|uniref:Cytokinin riboside 5'-monophosphate phosphoribohydrolase n=2 Tax=Calycomorphotria hydatis TaxID=2528027 RepID=A0A517T4H3_9PLAN|nr:TIGR00730 family Rossman fold protein [Calycomorphotria hydatis]QDT63265.1 LOG family protein YvdD [Calycomorphotria hydatis]